jgi:hypothetical protein
LLTVTVVVTGGDVTVAVPPGDVTVVVPPAAVVVTVLVLVTVVVSPLQADSMAMEPTAVPPTTRPASLRNSLRDRPFTSFSLVFSSSMKLFRILLYNNFNLPGKLVSLRINSFPSLVYVIVCWG